MGPLNQTIFYKCFSGRTFQLRYYFWTLHEATLLSIQHTYELLLYALNSPVQFCPSPVYPAWQSHTCDPMVLVQFAFSWQEWFPLHSSMSIKSQIKKKWDLKSMQRSQCISHNCVKACKPRLFSTFCWIARTRDCRTWWKQVMYVKSSHFITLIRVTALPLLKN